MTYKLHYDEAKRFKKDLETLWRGEYPGHVAASYKIDTLEGLDHSVYHTNKKHMFNIQMNTIEVSIKERCPFIPSLWPDLGVVTIGTGFGSKAAFPSHSYPAIVDYAINDVRDTVRLQKPDFHKDGLMPYVLECINYFKEQIGDDIPIGICDVQSPAEAAFQVCNHEEFLIGTALYPEQTHNLLSLCMETILEFTKYQKEIIGQSIDEFYGFNQFYIPKGFGGIYATQDFAAEVSHETYHEFGFPYASRLFEAMNGGIVHNCGRFEHNLEEFKKLPYVRCLDLGTDIPVVDPKVTYEKVKGKFFLRGGLLQIGNTLEEKVKATFQELKGIPYWLYFEIPLEKSRSIKDLVNRLSE